MDNILSTLKGEYARTLLLILIPGAIAFEPFSIMLYKDFSLRIENLHEYVIYAALVYFLASIFCGFIIQDLGSNLEMKLDKIFCKRKKKNRANFYRQFETYLFNKKEEDYI